MQENNDGKPKNLTISLSPSRIVTTIVSAAIVLGGGTGGVQALGTLTEIAQKTSETANEVRNLSEKITSLDKSMLGVNAEIEALRRADAQAILSITDHETRLRKVEGRQ